jgi:hypothetical protein
VAPPPSNFSLPQPPVPISIESGTFPVGEVPNPSILYRKYLSKRASREYLKDGV